MCECECAIDVIGSGYSSWRRFLVLTSCLSHIFLNLKLPQIRALQEVLAFQVSKHKIR